MLTLFFIVAVVVSFAYDFFVYNKLTARIIQLEDRIAALESWRESVHSFIRDTHTVLFPDQPAPPVVRPQPRPYHRIPLAEFKEMVARCPHEPQFGDIFAAEHVSYVAGTLEEIRAASPSGSV